MIEFDTIGLKQYPPMCGTCTHCSAIVYGKSLEGFHVAAINGDSLCRRYPPMIGAFPTVDPRHDHCGEYKPRGQEEINAVAMEARNQILDIQVTIPEKPGMEVQ